MEFKTPAACRNVGDTVLSHEHGGELWSNITLKSVQNFYCKQNQIVNVINFFDALMMMMIMLNVWVLQSKIINLGRQAGRLTKVAHSWCRIKILGTNSMRNFFFMLSACDICTSTNDTGIDRSLAKPWCLTVPTNFPKCESWSVSLISFVWEQRKQVSQKPDFSLLRILILIK